MATAPQLLPANLRLLKMVDAASRHGTVRGGQIMRALGLDRKVLTQMLEDLSAQDLVIVSGPRIPDRIDLAVVAVHPSNRVFVRSA